MVCPVSLWRDASPTLSQSTTLALSLHLRVHSLSADAQGQDWWPLIQVLEAGGLSGLHRSLPCWGQHCSWAPRKRSHGQQQNICNYVDWKMPGQHRHTGLPLCSVSSGSKSLLQVWTKLTFSFIKQFIQDCTCNVSFQRTCNNQEHSDSMRSLPTSKHHRTRQIIFSCLQL